MSYSIMLIPVGFGIELVSRLVSVALGLLHACQQKSTLCHLVISHVAINQSCQFCQMFPENK